MSNAFRLALETDWWDGIQSGKRMPDVATIWVKETVCFAGHDWSYPLMPLTAMLTNA